MVISKTKSMNDLYIAKYVFYQALNHTLNLIVMEFVQHVCFI